MNKLLIIISEKNEPKEDVKRKLPQKGSSCLHNKFPEKNHYKRYRSITALQPLRSLCGNLFTVKLVYVP